MLADEDDEKLINLVSQHHPLFDPQHAGYKDHVLQNNLWKEIAGELINKNSLFFKVNCTATISHYLPLLLIRLAV